MEVSGLQEPVKLMDETVFSSWMFMVYTGACVAHGRVWATGACVAHGRVWATCRSL
jgi:hypothetical protein